MTRRKTPTIESFDPRFIQWWIEGSRKSTPMEFPTYNEAASTRLHILYPLRKIMNSTDHYAARMANKCECIIRPVDTVASEKTDPHHLIIRPVDSKFDAAFDAAGIKLPDLEEDTHDD